MSGAIRVELRPGGADRFAADQPGAGRRIVGGEFSVVEPPERLVYTFVWEGYVDDVTVVTVEFHARGDETV
jgi:uncharacterized protein YndB with AHSA1/START domain